MAGPAVPVAPKSAPTTPISKTGHAMPVVSRSAPTTTRPCAALGDGGDGEGFTTVGGNRTDRQRARKQAYKKRRSTDKRHKKASYFPGVVFSTAYYEQDYDPVGRPGDNNFSVTGLGGVQGKFRKMVVVRQFDDHCVALPIFTYHGQGLKSSRNFYQHINIRDREDNDAKEVAGAYPPLLVDKRLELPPKAYHHMSKSAFCHITLPISHKYTFFATLEGTLDDNCTRRLQEIFARQMKLA